MGFTGLQNRKVTAFSFDLLKLSKAQSRPDSNQVPLSAAAHDPVKDRSTLALLAHFGRRQSPPRFADEIEHFPNANFRDRPS